MHGSVTNKLAGPTKDVRCVDQSFSFRHKLTYGTCTALGDSTHLHVRGSSAALSVSMVLNPVTSSYLVSGRPVGPSLYSRAYDQQVLSTSLLANMFLVIYWYTKAPRLKVVHVAVPNDI